MAWRQCIFFDELRKRVPDLLVLANDVDMGHMPHLNGRFFEGRMLLDQLAVHGRLTSSSPQEAVRALNSRLTNSIQPGITFAVMAHPMVWGRPSRIGRGAGKAWDSLTPGAR